MHSKGLQKLGFNEKIGVICVPKDKFLGVFFRKNGVNIFGPIQDSHLCLVEVQLEPGVLLGVGPPDHLLPVRHGVEEVPPVVGGAGAGVDPGHAGVHVGHDGHSNVRTVRELEGGEVALASRESDGESVPGLGGQSVPENHVLVFVVVPGVVVMLSLSSSSSSSVSSSS